MLFLKQSTASQSVIIGPFVDSGDGNTQETALTIANTDIRLSKNGGNLAAKNSGGGTHDEEGWYTITLDATDTNTVGRLQLFCHIQASALPVFAEFQVLEEAIYDALFAASANAFTGAAGSTTLTALADNAISAAKIAADAITEAKIADNAIAAEHIAAGAIGATEIANGAIDAATFAAGAIDAAALAADALTAIGGGVWNEDATGHQTQGTFGQAIGDPVADTNTIFKATVTDATGATVGVDGAAILADTADMQPKLGSPAADVSADIAAVKAETALIVGDTNELQTDDVPGLIAALNNISAADVNTQVADVMKTDTLTATPQGAPATTPTFETAIMVLYDALVHGVDVTATLKSFKNNAGTVIWKKTLSDDATTYAEAESVTGP